MDQQIYFSEDLLVDIELTGIKEIFSTKRSGGYQYYGRYVPRVSEIIQDATGWKTAYEFVMDVKNIQKCKEIKKTALDTGSLAHSMIEDYLLEGSKKDSTVYMKNAGYMNANSAAAINAYNNFLSWMSYMKNAGFKINVLKIEEKIVCPWYGGTCDMIAEVTNPAGITKIYIFDFKTSKAITYDYFLQAMFYMKAINYNRQNIVNYELPNIDGIAILRLDKNKNQFDYLPLDIEINMPLLNHLNQTCNTMINQYYYLKSAQYQFKEYSTLNMIRGDKYGIDI